MDPFCHVINYPSKEAANIFLHYASIGKRKKKFFYRRSNTPKQRLNQTSCLFPVAKALDRTAVDLGRHSPCHEHRLSPHFSLLGLFGGQKVSAARSALEQSLMWLHSSGGSYPKSHGEGRPGVSQRKDFTVLPLCCYISTGRSRQRCEHLPSAPCHSCEPVSSGSGVYPA